jgi:hypothetical protein
LYLKQHCCALPQIYQHQESFVGLKAIVQNWDAHAASKSFQVVLVKSGIIQDLMKKIGESVRITSTDVKQAEYRNVRQRKMVRSRQESMASTTTANC